MAIRRMFQRRGTSEQWSAANPVLGDGEIGWDRSEKRFKVGDGLTAWNSLPWGAVDESTLAGTYVRSVNGETVDENGNVVVATTEVPEEVIEAAVTENLAGRDLVEGEELAGDEFGVRFDDGTYFVRANEEDGLTSKITHQPDSVPTSALVPMANLTPESGWDWVIMTEDRRAVVGQRSDGSLYGLYEPEPEVLDPVVFIGDSLSANWGPYLGGMVTALDGRSVITTGIGGQTSPQIAARQGGVPAMLTVSGNAIPASGAVNVTAWSTNLLQITTNGSRSIQGVLCGIPGTLTATRADGPTYAYTFTRTTAGTVTPCPPQTPFQCGFADRGKIPIVCVGRNNINDTPDSIVAHVRAILEYSGSAKALVMSVPPEALETNNPTPTTDRAKVDAINAALRTAFGPYWVDGAAHLRSADTLASVGLTPTATDLQNITDGVTPESFRLDAVHYSAKAYEALTALIDHHFSSKGW